MMQGQQQQPPARRRPVRLLKFIPALSPKFREPTHLRPVETVFDRVERREGVRVFMTLPPRHAKTETLKHAIVRLLLIDPSLRIGYVSYSARLAEKKSREIRLLYQRAGGTLAPDAFARADWRTGVGDGGLWAVGVEGSLTGEGFDLLVIDDPIQDRAHAESSVEREKLKDWFNDVAFTRLEPDGSIIVVHTRWHTQDLGGYLIAEGWEHIHLPAILTDGTALWPERFTLAQLLKIKKQLGEYAWASLYMGTPYSRGGRLFGDPSFYERLPAKLEIVIGIDLAYSKKSQADYSVAIVFGFDPESPDEHPTIYVLHVDRAQCQAPEFISRMQALQERYNGAPLYWYHGGGGEKGVGDVIQALGLDIEARQAPADKFIRAQAAAAAWNAKRILLPRNRDALAGSPGVRIEGGLVVDDGAENDNDGRVPWVNDLVSELLAFSGVNDNNDDQVDALVSGHDAAQLPGWQRAMRAAERNGGLFQRPPGEDQGDDPNKLRLCRVCKVFSRGPCPKHGKAA